jgi:hypothetical protein
MFHKKIVRFFGVPLDNVEKLRYNANGDVFASGLTRKFRNFWLPARNKLSGKEYDYEKKTQPDLSRTDGVHAHPVCLR